MQTLNYIGSKKTLFNNILNVCQKNIPSLSTCVFSDLFAGTGTVGFNMKSHCQQIIANDLEYYSYIINYALLKCLYTNQLEILINQCNQLEPINDGLMYKNYSPNDNCERMFFTNDNAQKCDAIRLYIHNLYIDNKITMDEYYFLVASLIVSMDKVANTSSVYGAYLKKYKSSAKKELILKPIHTNQLVPDINNEVYNENIETFVIGKQFDIVYLDPPYNQRQYSSNYSPLNYIAMYNESIELTGKTGLIKDYNKSTFCSKPNVKKSFQDLINNLNCNYIILSYNNEGLLKVGEIKEILCHKGNVILYKKQYNKFKAQSKVKDKKVEEYIWFVDVNKKQGKFIEKQL